MKLINRWLPAIIIAAFIFGLSARHGTSFAPDYFWNYLVNKGAHLFWYFILCFTFYRGTKSIPAAIALTFLYGMTDELHQQFVPTRTGQLSDVFIDGAAGGFAGVILWKFYPSLPKTLKSWLKA